jgi:lysophospholipase L1-like esterase
MRYLALGDSYTIGDGVEPEDGWPVRLAALILLEGFAASDPQIVAHTGWTTDDVGAGIDRARLRGTFDLVTLLVGVNDQYRGGDVEGYRSRFRTLLKRAVTLAGGEAGRVVVLSIPDWGVTPFAEGRDRARIAAEIDRFNEANRAETKSAGARYVDVTGLSRRAAPAGSGTLVAPDGLHPSGAMYAEWALLVLPHALAALGRV